MAVTTPAAAAALSQSLLMPSFNILSSKMTKKNAITGQNKADNEEERGACLPESKDPGPKAIPVESNLDPGLHF